VRLGLSGISTAKGAIVHPPHDNMSGYEAEMEWYWQVKPKYCTLISLGLGPWFVNRKVNKLASYMCEANTRRLFITTD
jgi:hypothetical protein